MAWVWDGTVYTRANGYGNVDVDSEQFQLGMRLYEAQVVHAKIEAGEEVKTEEVKELARRYCELVHAVGELRYDYRCMREVAEGKAVFREQ